MNPVINRELIAQLRRSRAFVLLFILLLFAGVIFSLFYYPVAQTWPHGGKDGRTLFFPIAYLMLLLAIPIATIAGTSIVREREENTLDLLLNTPLGPFSLLFGKYVASVLYAVLLLTSFLPFVALSFVFGGLSPSEVFQCLLIVAGLFAISASVGLVVSLFSTSSSTAVRVSIMVLIFLTFGPPALKVMSDFLLWGQPSEALQPGPELWVNPLFGVRAIQIPDNPAKPFVAVRLSPHWFPRVLNANAGIPVGFLNVALSLLLFLFAVIMLRTFASHLSARFKWKSFLTPLRHEVKTPAQKKAAGYIIPTFGLNGDAVYQKEILTYNRKVLSSDITMAVCSGLVAVFLAWLLFKMSYDVDDLNFSLVYILLCIFGILITFLFAPVAPSYSILNERQRETWSLLRATTLRSKDVIDGKIRGCVRQALIPLLSIFICFYLTSWLLFILVGSIPQTWLFFETSFLLGFFFCCIYFYGCYGVACSSRADQSHRFPYRRIFAISAVHLLSPYLILAILQKICEIGEATKRVLFSVGGPGRSQGRFDVFETQLGVIERISPLWLMRHDSWGRDIFMTVFAYCFILLALAWMMRRVAYKRIEILE